MLTSIKEVIKKNFLGKNVKKSWAGAQNYELIAAFEYMQTNFFKEVHKKSTQPSDKISNGYFDETMTKEFFQSDKKQWDAFVEHMKGKNCLDVGPCIASPWRRFDIASTRYAVEPLFTEVDAWQRKNLHSSLFENINTFSSPAEELVEELVGKIDGAILCRNMLDHTPQWPFVMANMAKYAKSGCKLLLWTDLDHGEGGDEGHFTITTHVAHFKLLVETLGFRIISENKDANRLSLNWGCLAEKI
jgi:hypothetical protein